MRFQYLFAPHPVLFAVPCPWHVMTVIK
jgi:hypothetical protein